MCMNSFAMDNFTKLPTKNEVRLIFGQKENSDSINIPIYLAKLIGRICDGIENGKDTFFLPEVSPDIGLLICNQLKFLKPFIRKKRSKKISEFLMVIR